MRKHTGLIIKIACYLLAGLLVYQFAGIALRFKRSSVTIPELPTLPGDQAAGKGTNSTTSPAPPGKGTNTVKVAGGTNSTSPISVAGTNVAGTNIMAGKETNSVSSVETAKAETNSPSGPRSEPDKTGAVVSAAPVKADQLSNAVLVVTGTNGQPAISMAGTNPAAHVASAQKGTNAGSPRDLAMAGSNPRSAPPRKSDLPPEIKARIDRIVESEIMGQVTRPMPMALIGIAGNSAILRTPSGQTGLVKEGDELGGIKLLQIGINRVLVEEQGQKKELTIFSGFGSESLLSKPKETPDETTRK